MISVEECVADGDEAGRTFEFHLQRLLKLLEGNPAALLEVVGLLKAFRGQMLATQHGFEYIAEELAKLKL